MKISIRVSPQANRVISGLKTDLAKKVRSISNDLFTSLKKFTPVRSGRARNACRKQDGRFKFTIRNNVPYIGRLDDGYSNQSPKGMTRPAVREVANKYRRKR